MVANGYLIFWLSKYLESGSEQSGYGTNFWIGKRFGSRFESKDIGSTMYGSRSGTLYVPTQGSKSKMRHECIHIKIRCRFIGPTSLHRLIHIDTRVYSFNSPDLVILYIRKCILELFYPIILIHHSFCWIWIWSRSDFSNWCQIWMCHIYPGLDLAY